MEDEYQLLTLVLHGAFRQIIEGGIVCRAFFEGWLFQDRAGNEKAESDFKDSYFGRKFPMLEEETWFDVVAKTHQQVRIEPRFRGLRCHVLAEPPGTPHDSNAFWPNFYREHPNAFGIFEMSRVGFNATRNQALLSIGLQSDKRVGKGYLFFLTRTPEWTITGQTEAWVS